MGGSIAVFVARFESDMRFGGKRCEGSLPLRLSFHYANPTCEVPALLVGEGIGGFRHEGLEGVAEYLRGIGANDLAPVKEHLKSKLAAICSIPE